MKRLWQVVAVAFCAMLIGGCGSGMPKDTSKEAYNIGLEALESLDYFLDEKMSMETLNSKLKELEKNAKEQAEVTGLINDDSIALYIYLAEFASNDLYTDEEDTYKIEEARNNLAEQLGK
jgi:hypothetical protein|uniref:Lipoprotein n=1 Tax=Siphoviridae sp. ctWDo30 TaxID=2826360 RepID=A0A8S5N620_9CAUD|nr:MAG TPA: lipoprotein [Siphoviridae sp. ctWDo30]